MSKSLITYFSMGGTTAQVAEAIASGLCSAGWEVDLCEMGANPSLDGYDLLGIGLPSYYFCPPFSVLDWVNSLPRLDGLAVFVFVLHGTFIGDAGNVVRRVLVKKGAREVGYWRCYGADFYQGYLEQGYLFSADHPTADELAQAQEFGRQVAAVVAGAEYARPRDDPSPMFIHRLERLLASRWLARRVYSRFFRVNREKCTACGLCAKRCPLGNISEDEDGFPSWGRDCLLCVMCHMDCPQEAITSPVSWRLLRPMMLFNVRYAARDPALDYVRVEHRRGRTRRV